MKKLLKDFQKYAATAAAVRSLMERMANRLHEKMTRYNWAEVFISSIRPIRVS